MSIHVSQLDTETVRYNTRSAKQGRSRSEAKFEVRGGHRVRSAGVIDVEPTEVHSPTQVTALGKSSEKGLKISKPRSHVASSRHEGTRRSNVTIEHVSTAIHYIGSPRPTRSKENATSTPKSSSGISSYHCSVMADSERSKLGARIPGIPEVGQDEQPTTRVERTVHNSFTATPSTHHAYSFVNSSTPVTSVQSLVTDSNNSTDVSSFKQPGKQAQGLRVKGQSGLKMQRNAGAEFYPNKTDRSDPYGKPKSRSEYPHPIIDLCEMEGSKNRGARSKVKQTENITTESGEGMDCYEYEKQAQFSRQTQPNYKYYSPNRAANTSSSFTGSGSDGFISSSDTDVSCSSADLSRSHSSSSKRRKRVRRKASAKSIGSSMYGDDNTSDGESATDSLRRVPDRRTRKRDDENAKASAGNYVEQSKGQVAVSGTSTPVTKGIHFRSSSLTSVSSVEGSKGDSRTTSPLQTPRGATLAKKIQIQSFSAAYLNFNKENIENQPRRRSSTEEHGHERIRERSSLGSDHSGSKASLDRESPQSGPQPSKGRPFSLRNKPFQLKRSSSKETSPCTSDADSPGTPTPIRHRRERVSPEKDISIFTDKPSSLASVSPTPIVTPTTTMATSTPEESPSSHYSVPNSDDDVFSSAFTPVLPGSTRIPGYSNTASASPDDEPAMMEMGRTSVGEPTAAISIPGSTQERTNDSDLWLPHSYPPSQPYPVEPAHTLGAPYGYRPLSIVNEQEEMEGLVQSSSENIENSQRNSHAKRPSTTKYGESKKGLGLVEKELSERIPSSAMEDSSSLRRPSYVRAQEDVGSFSLFRSFDLDPSLPPFPMSGAESDSNLSVKESDDTMHSVEKSRTLSENSLEDYDPQVVLRSFSGSDIAAGDPLAAIVKGGDLITFEDEQSDHGTHRGSVAQGMEYSGEPVKKRKKKLARPKIPTIFDLDDTKQPKLDQEVKYEEEEHNNEMALKPREETMGQESMDEKCIGGSLEEDLDMIEGSSKRNTLVAIESDDDSTPKENHSPTSEAEEDLSVITEEKLRMKPQILSEDFSEKARHQRIASYSTPPEITTDMYVDDITENNEHCLSDLALKKVDTIYDLSEKECQSRGLPYFDQETSDALFQDTKSVESYESESDPLDSPSPSQLSIDKYSLTTSGFSEVPGDLSDSGDIPVDMSDIMLSSGKTSADGRRSHSDPSRRTNGAGAALSETIAEAELTVYRNSNSAPNLISEKLKKESAELAKRVNKNQLDARPTVTRTHSSPSALLKPSTQRLDEERRKSEGSKDDFHIEGSPDECYELDKPESYQKSPRKAKSAPTTPTSHRKQLYSNQFSAEKTQMKLAKLAAMEPIYETPQTEPVKPLPEPVKLERKSGLLPVEDVKRPPVTGLQGTKTQTKPQTKPSKSKHDMRRHVLQNLLDTEQSYVQNLQYMVTNYLKPLKKQENASIVEPAQADEMFYQIPDILLCHEFFLEQLQARVNDWHDKQKIGDIIVASFTKCFLMDAYSAFINHFLHARAAVRVATMSRPGFSRFIEQCCRDHREKLTLQDLMIMPVQRIPRYVLILKDMIKHTSADHPDHGSLQLALGEIKTLANRMNMREKEVNKAEKDAEDLRAIEASIEGISDLVIPGRYFKRKDLAAEVRGSITKKDRNLFLFNDLMVCAVVKRKPNALRRGSLSLFSGQSGTQQEFNKHKLLWKLPLEYVELVRSSPEMQRRNSLEKELERLDNDISLLGQISSLSETLNISHQVLDSSIRELMNDVSGQIAARQVPIQQSMSSKLDLQAQTEEGLENFSFLLLDAEIKNSWEADFENAKKELAHAKDTFPPEFQQPIPITKTRSGMQFTCSSPSQVPHMLDRGNHCGSGDVWVCNSDGYVGQVCVLSVGEQIKPLVSLSVCSSRILCISPVPGANLIGLETQQADADAKSDTRSLSLSSETAYKVSSQKLSSEYNSDDDVHSAQAIMAFDSSSEDEDGLGNDSFLNGKFGSGSPMFDGRLSPEGSSLGTIDGEMDSSEDDHESDFDDNGTSDDEYKAKGGRKHGKRRSNPLTGAAHIAEDKLSDIVPYATDEGSTVWLGTEDGSIFVYPVQNVHQKKNKMKIQHLASVQCILYVDNQVFVCLGNGDLCVYRRQPGCAWEVAAPVILHVGSAAPVSCMTAVHGRLWCGCQCNAVIFNTTTLKIETSFNCSLDKDRAVYRMVSSGMGVWLSLQSSATVRLFHATRYECLADVDVGPPVHKMLAGSDAIIRQHKAACLRVTSLLTCKDLLWIGTSAGVVLTLPLPTLTAATSSLRNIPTATASFHGHTGHVRFLTAVEVPKEGTLDSTSDKEVTSPISTPTSTTHLPLTPGGPGSDNGTSGDILIISGGDGYEDFKTSSSSESAGRDDSTNHLLIWQV